MTSDLQYEPDAKVPLKRPIAVVALGGLFDVGGAATAAVDWLRTLHDGFPVAAIDPEEYFDFQQQRPMVELDDDGARRIRWPENRFYGATTGDSHDLLLLSGIEPHLRWRTFCESMHSVVHELGAEMVVTLGSSLGMAPHTRPLEVVGSAVNRTLASRLGLGSPSYQGPTGVLGAFNDLLDRSGVPVISLRVSVPHYVQGSPNPKATQALLRKFALVTGVTTGAHELDDAAEEWRVRVDEAVRDDQDIQGYVAQLERQIDESADLMSGADDLVDEVERFLREQHGD